MRRTSSRTEPRLAAVAGAVLGAALVGGCAAMPDAGGIAKVELSQGAADKNLQVRVFPVAPAKGAKPGDLLTGFLDASTADDGYPTARQYLTEEAAGRWNPEAGIMVLAANPTHNDQTLTEADTSVSIPVSGMVVAQVDEKHSYRFREGQKDVSFTFNFVREKSGEWRIDRLPDGLIINETNFRNSYRQVDRFFYAAADPSAPTAQEVLIADPIYLRRRIDPLTAAARALVAGPSEWLSPVVRSAFPAGVTVQPVTVDDSRTAHVVAAGPDLGGGMLCKQMANQLLYTLGDQGKGQMDRLELKGPRGSSCVVARNDLPASAPGALAGSAADQQYYQRADNGVLLQAREQGEGSAVAGVLGKAPANGKRAVGAIAVSRNGQRAAAISPDGHQLYSVGLADSESALPDPVLSTTPRPADKGEDGLASPSWDGRGDLWVVDRDPQAPRVVMVRGRKPVTVPVEGLDGGTVQSLKTASDGVRIALVVKDRKGDRSLMVGLVQHGGTQDAPTARITGLRNAAPQLTDVTSVSWAEADQLLVLGKEKDRLPQLHYISTDGSRSTEGSLLGGEGMVSVQASESRDDTAGQAPPVLALQGADGKIYRLVNNQWRELVLPPQYRASAFIYPG
ncbi:LpqB family beta-propeller domain-containing protein [Kitasatospora sp. NPDC058170]|uniref:LpqB family beta-propeller domain-containing protein n=1 Tax=Kitasatospora sp. NPDC058170 TaxID=3346364 RepID=UPI0036DE8641